jgi:hypothetical protein
MTQTSTVRLLEKTSWLMETLILVFFFLLAVVVVGFSIREVIAWAKWLRFLLS